MHGRSRGSLRGLDESQLMTKNRLAMFMENLEQFPERKGGRQDKGMLD